MKSKVIYVPINEDKLPPHDIALEEVVLGQIILLKDTINLIGDRISVNHFYKPQHRYIMQAILNLSYAGEPIDTMSIIHQLTKKSQLELVGGPSALMSLTTRVVSNARIERDLMYLNELMLRRDMIGASTAAYAMSYDMQQDILNTIDSYATNINNITKTVSKSNIESLHEIGKRFMHDLNDTSRKIPGIYTGFSDLDRYTLGWQPSQLIIVAARPGMGKTAFVLNSGVRSARIAKRPVVIFSLEMSKAQLVSRLISSETGIESRRIKKKEIDLNEKRLIADKLNEFADLIYIDDEGGISPLELRIKCKRLKKEINPCLIIIDYLQLMRSSGNYNNNREAEVSEISRTLKAIAKELDTPVIALSQLSRKVEERPDKKPRLSDLRESGSIEQDADVVLFIYRPEYYGITHDPYTKSDITGLAEIIIAKQRDGATDMSAILTWKKDIVRFEDYVSLQPFELALPNLLVMKKEENNPF